MRLRPKANDKLAAGDTITAADLNRAAANANAGSSRPGGGSGASYADYQGGPAAARAGRMLVRAKTDILPVGYDDKWAADVTDGNNAVCVVRDPGAGGWADQPGVEVTVVPLYLPILQNEIFTAFRDDRSGVWVPEARDVSAFVTVTQPVADSSRMQLGVVDRYDNDRRRWVRGRECFVIDENDPLAAYFVGLDEVATAMPDTFPDGGSLLADVTSTNG